MNNNFLAHIIRDIFHKKNFTVYYGLDYNFISTLKSNEHSIGAFHVHSENSLKEQGDGTYYWLVNTDALFFEANCCDLFISYDYDPDIEQQNIQQAINYVHEVIKPGGLLFLVNPGKVFSDIPDTFINRWDLVQELKRYKMLSDKEVFVYESI